MDLLDLAAEVIGGPLITSSSVLKLMELNPRLAVFATVFPRWWGAKVNKSL